MLHCTQRMPNETVAGKRAKICCVCHMAGDTKPKCRNSACPGFESCKLPLKHPELNKELMELKALIKNLEKKGREGEGEEDTLFK